MSEGQPTQMTDGYQSTTDKRRNPSSKFPLLAMVLTIVGDFIYLGFGVGVFIGFAESGVFSYATTVLFITTVGVFGCGIMMSVKPKLHLVWGIVVLGFSGWALTAWGSFLYGSYSYASSIVGPAAILGTIFWNIPLGLVLAGGALAIHWKPPTSSLR